MAFRGDFYQQCPTCHLNQPAPDRQGLCRQLCQAAAFLPCSPGWPEAPSWWHGHPLLAATSLGGQSWQHGVMSSPLLGWRATRTPLQSPGGFMQLTVDQIGTCHRDAVGQTCCKPKSPEPLGWGLKLDCGHTALPSTTVNPAACVAGRLGTTDRHGNEQRDVRGCDLSPPPPSHWENRIKCKYFLWGMKANWKLPAFFLIVHIQVYNGGNQPTLCSYINQNLVRNISEENSDQLYVYHSPLEGEKEKKRKRKTAWFLILEISHLSHLISDIPSASINNFSFK